MHGASIRLRIRPVRHSVCQDQEDEIKRQRSCPADIPQTSSWPLCPSCQTIGSRPFLCGSCGKRNAEISHNHECAVGGVAPDSTEKRLKFAVNGADPKQGRGNQVPKFRLGCKARGKTNRVLVFCPCPEMCFLIASVELCRGFLQRHTLRTSRRSCSSSNPKKFFLRRSTASAWIGSA